MSFLQNLRRRSTDSETFLIPEGSQDLVPSRDATRLAYVVPERGGVRLEISGHRLAAYERIARVTFSADSLSLVFIAQGKQGWMVVFNGNEGQPWDEIGRGSPILSANSKRVAYTARKGNQWFAVMNGNVLGGPYDAFKPGGIVFSPDGERVAYAVRNGGEEYTVEDGIQRGTFPAIMDNSWTFTPDSQHVAYIAGLRGEWKGETFVGEAAVIQDGRVGQVWPWDGLTGRDGPLGELYFSPDSNRLAYGVIQNGKRFFVIDNVRQKDYDNFVSGWAGNPDWLRQPFYGNASCRSDVFRFSPDSQHFAYAAQGGGHAVLNYDGTERAKHMGFLPRPILFSPDGARLAYAISDGTRQRLVVERTIVETPRELPLSMYSFSPSGAALALMASNGALYSCAVGTHSWSRRGAPISGANLVWDNDSQFHTLIQQGREVTVARFDAP